MDLRKQLFFQRNRVGDGIGPHRLGDIVKGSFFQTFHGDGRTTLGIHADQQNADGLLANPRQFAERLEGGDAPHPGHLNVKRDEIGQRHPGELNRFLATPD